MVLACLAAYFLRVNIPVAILVCWVTNPLTAPVVYTLQYKLGVWLGGSVQADELQGYNGALRNFILYIRPLWVGSLASGIFFATIAYAVVYIGWVWVANLSSGGSSRLHTKQEAQGLSSPFARPSHPPNRESK